MSVYTPSFNNLYQFGKFSQSIGRPISKIYNAAGVSNLSKAVTLAGYGAGAIGAVAESPVLAGIATVGAAIYGGKQIYEGLKDLF
jgi:hypothetical protein